MITRESNGVRWTNASTRAAVDLVAGVGSRPYLHPIKTTGGRVVTENAPAHHPWQHGLYFGLNGVNGVGFWTEGLLAGRDRDGRIAVTACDADGDGWRVEADWLSPEGDVLLRDTQHWSAATVVGDTLRLDVRWTFVARTAVTLAAYPYGGLFLRMPFKAGVDASILTSTGAASVDAVEGARAEWLRVAMAVEGGVASVAILDHPSNPDHPTPWRADGEYGVGPAMQRSAARSFVAGEGCHYTYRVLVADGTLAADALDAAYKAFCGDPA